MFISNDDHCDFLEECIDLKPSTTIISTFGVYAGITFNGSDSTEWGEEYSLRTRTIIDKLSLLNNVTIIVGLAKYKSCKEQLKCLHCERQYVKSLFRLLFHVDKFDGIIWKYSLDLHIKASLFYYDKFAKGVAGGRNFTNSSWPDLTFELSEYQIMELREHINKVLVDAVDITDNTISELIKSENISLNDLDI